MFLGLFMWGHMAFVSSILISKEAMWWITKMFEGQFFFGRPYPAIVSCVVGLMSVIFMLHAALAMRKFPANFREYHNFRGHDAIILSLVPPKRSSSGAMAPIVSHCKRC